MAGATARSMSPGMRWGLAVFAMLVVGLLAWVFSMVERTVDRESARSKLIFEAHSAVSATDLRDCLESRRIDGLGIYRKGGAWNTPDEAPNISRAESRVRHTRVEIVEVGEERILRFYTRDGSPMQHSERALIDTCLAGRPG
jgi:cbb3-type cytochrome oxidase subunit 3